MIKLYEEVVSAPVVIAESVIVFVIAQEIHIAIPINVLRVFSVLLNIFKSKEVSSRVVEYSVEDYFYTGIVTGFNIVFQILISSEP